MPAICSICHTRPGPRGPARFPFEKPNQPSQFSAIFPHDKHQDVIATNNASKNFEAAHAKQRRTSVQEKAVQKYNNCTICHDTQPAMTNTRGSFPDGFKPPEGTFKLSPSGHDSCFNCHWKNQAPSHNDCGGCHRLSPTDIADQRIPPRLSLKFIHTREQHVKECTACHINITRVSSLRGLKPDVPITSCSECHKTSTAEGAVTIETEFEMRKKDAGFVCAKCHTSEVGKKPMPASHGALFAQ